MAASSLANSTTSRLRKTFKFASDAMNLDNNNDNDNDDPSDLDEEEQESLITSLSTSNESANTLYARVFTVIPLLGTVPFWWTLLVTAPFRRDGGVALRTVFVPCLLGITSLALSALVMGFVPLDHSSSGFATATVAGQQHQADNNNNNSSSSSTSTTRRGTLSDIAHSQAARRHATSAGRGAMLGIELPFCIPVDAQGPVARYAMPLNGVLSVWMAVFSVLLMDSVKVGPGFWLLCLLPGVMAVVVFVVRGAMRDAERGLGELKGLRYGYKGA